MRASGIISSRLTVFFEDPFWVGVFERTENGKLSACKITFGVEPKDYDVWEFALKKYYGLKFSPEVIAEVKAEPVNPKRKQRELKRAAQSTGVGTKSQQALQMQREENKIERRIVGKRQKEEMKAMKFALHRQKRKEKHKGR